MIKEISRQQLQQVIANQKSCESEAPITTRATFKLSELEDLIKSIKKVVPEIKTTDEESTHYVCITFVRDTIGKEIVFDNRHTSELKRYANKKGFTQLIPIITGCIGKLDKLNYSYEKGSFHYLKGKTIEVLCPGGEGTGLIPPPPSGGE